jgi:hypothetical protein
VSGDYGFTVTAAVGSPGNVNSSYYRNKPIVMLCGGPASDHGIVIGIPCRLVTAPASDLKFSGIGELLPMPAKDVREAERDRERWVVLEPADKAAPWPKELFGEQVRLEYDPEAMTAAQARHARPRSG